MIVIVSHAVKRLAAAVLLRAVKDANGEVNECPKRMRPFYQKDAIEFFTSGDYEYWADLAGINIPVSVLKELIA